MKLLITGADGFVGKNLRTRLGELGRFEILPFGRSHTPADLERLAGEADLVIHLAGVNRPPSPEQFTEGNSGFTAELCRILAAVNPGAPVIFSSSTQAELDNAYGHSKKAAEDAIRQYAAETGAKVAIYRLPNVFGKWSRPNYNSAVATFCHNLTRGLPIQINDPSSALTLVYIDDVVAEFIAAIDQLSQGVQPAAPRVAPEYRTTVGEVADQLRAFVASRDTLVTERVGTGLTRALYATYVSFLPTEAFAYGVPAHGDPRGVFVEMLKTPDSGQFSFFTAHPGITRGGHYHHSKTEKFLVIKGEARFRFRHMLTDERHELFTSGAKPTIVETVPGWTHDITNVGSDEMIVMLWANEIFDRQRPDTIASEVWK
jgi:UDP-2-acetamido-2,6-beta-L-arabino-hexul-4-ose reductase